MTSRGKYRTWIEINAAALRHNIEQLRELTGKKTRFMAMVKSNAYGHGLVQVASQLANHKSQITNHKQIWFGVDSIVEALRLRRGGIANPILVLGFTLPARIGEATRENISLTVSNFDALNVIAKIKTPPRVHVKVDTGMHRQGFMPGEVPQALKIINKFNLKPQGVYTHFAVAKDVAYPTYTLDQFSKLKNAVKIFEKAGHKNFIKHAAATGGTMLFPETHLDMVRVGMGLYGYWPSQESKTQYSLTGNIRLSLEPVLQWKTVVAETKEMPAGSYVGYDLTERVNRDTKTAVLPIGYWHGYDRGLSSVGEVLIRGKRAKVLGRVSMDILVVDATGIKGVKTGDEVVLIGKQGNESVWADELSLKIGTTPYEFLTRINPLIKREFI